MSITVLIPTLLFCICIARRGCIRRQQRRFCHHPEITPPLRIWWRCHHFARKKRWIVAHVARIYHNSSWQDSVF